MSCQNQYSLQPIKLTHLLTSYEDYSSEAGETPQVNDEEASSSKKTFMNSHF